MVGDRLLRLLHHAIVAVVVIGSTLVLTAQTVVDPQFVEFAPSPDHNTNASDGTPLVSRYSLALYVSGSSTAFDTVDLGKPAPSAGVIRVNFIPLLHSVPTPNVVFEARVSAVGPGGSAPSTVSNGFSFTPTCTPAISPTGASPGSGAGTGSVGVTVASGCSWTAVSNAGWITLTGATGGSGNGSVPYSITANGTTSQRVGTISVAGLTYTITQAALSCSYSLTPTSQSVVASGGTGSTSVTAPSGCSWTAVSNNTGWLSVTSGASGSGGGTVNFSATANPNSTQRQGTLTIGGQPFTVTQAGIACSYALTPTSQSVVASGGTGSTSVTAPSGCSWTAVSNNTGWLSVTNGANGSGGGSVGFSATANPNGTQRQGTLTIGGQPFTVTQAGVACSYALTPTGQSVVASGGTGSTSVTAPSGCSWTAVSNNTGWLSVTNGANGSGGGSVSFSATANPNGTQRQGTLTIGGQPFTVTQAGVACSYALTPTGQSVAFGGGTGSTNVAAPSGCSWTAASNNTGWLSVTSGASGNGNGPVGFSATANPNGTQRQGTLTIGGQTFTVTQAPAGCTFSITPTGQSVVFGGGTGSTTVTATSGCSWTAVSNNTGWLSVTSGAGGTGGGTVNFSATANPNGTQRQGTLTVAGQTFTVTQAAAPCNYSITPTGQSVAFGGGTGSTTVTAPSGCAWTGVSNDTSWLSVTSGANGSGGGTVSFSATANPNGTQRQGTLTVAGQTFTVTEAAAPCTFSLSPASASVAATAGGGTTNVTAPGGCGWTAASNNTSWLTISSGSSGTGNGTVGFSVTANPNGTQRMGSLTIGGQTFNVTQAQVGCTYSISPASQNSGAAATSGSSNVTTQNGCPWSAQSNVGWISITSGSSGSGPGLTTFSVQANPQTTQRVGTLTIAAQTYTVTQAGGTCTISLSPTSASVSGAGGSGSTNVTAPAGCAWSASSNNIGWISVSGASSGSGNGTVSFDAIVNISSSPRNGSLTIGGQTFAINQAAACSFSISSTGQTIAAAAGSASTNVTAGSGCNWTASSNVGWITISTGASGSGNGSVTMSVTANTSSQQRSGAVIIAGKTFTVTQNGVTNPTTPNAPKGLRIVVVGGN